MYLIFYNIQIESKLAVVASLPFPLQFCAFTYITAKVTLHYCRKQMLIALMDFKNIKNCFKYHKKLVNGVTSFKQI